MRGAAGERQQKHKQLQLEFWTNLPSESFGQRGAIHPASPFVFPSLLVPNGVEYSYLQKTGGRREEVEFEMDVEVQTGLSGRNVGWDEGSWEGKQRRVGKGR